MKLSIIAEQCYADCHLCFLPFEFIKTVCRVIYTFYHKIEKMNVFKGAFTLANFAHDFALSLHVLQNKNYLFSLLNVQASAKSRAKSRLCKRTLKKKLQLHRKKIG
jgi:hypothetical protein